MSRLTSVICSLYRQLSPRRGNIKIGLILSLSCGLFGIGFSKAAAPAAPAQSSQVNLDPATESLSVFIDDCDYGKDPFFPKSTRRCGNPAPDPGPDFTHVDPDKIPWDAFELKGISISPSKRLALINKYTLAEGESRDFKFSAKNIYKLTCLKINERSALVSVRGQRKELSLREGL